MLNNRPLTYISSNVSDQEPLTPSHLLYGTLTKLLSYPLDDENASNTGNVHRNLNKLWEHRRLLTDQFWKRWKQEYLTSLREFHRTTGTNTQKVTVGDIVQIHDDSPRNTWKVAVIDSLVYGKDGLARSAVIRTRSGLTNRPIVKLYPLEINQKGESDETDELMIRK